jgi:hypothetical protein
VHALCACCVHALRACCVCIGPVLIRHATCASVWACTGQAAFDSKWVPPVGGAPSRHTGTGGAADGVHGQCLRDSGAGDRSRVVPRSKQLGGVEWRPERNKQLGKQPDEAMSSRASG